jgi:phage gp46-like protein
MELALNPISADYAGGRITTLANAVYIRLETPLASYWADPLLGSRLHELAREKDVPRARLLAKQYAEQALQPLISRGEAKSISVDSYAPHNGRLLLLVTVVDAGGREQTFKHPVHVG